MFCFEVCNSSTSWKKLLQPFRMFHKFQNIFSRNESASKCFSHKFSSFFIFLNFHFFCVHLHNKIIQIRLYLWILRVGRAKEIFQYTWIGWRIVETLMPSSLVMDVFWGWSMLSRVLVVQICRHFVMYASLSFQSAHICKILQLVDNHVIWAHAFIVWINKCVRLYKKFTTVYTFWKPYNCSNYKIITSFKPGCKGFRKGCNVWVENCGNFKTMYKLKKMYTCT